MSYIKTVWTNLSTALSAENFNHMENGIEALDTGKVDKVTGKGLSTNDYTTAEKNKLAGIEEGAKNNQNAFSYVKVDSTTIEADQPKDTLELVAGQNIKMSANASNDKVTIWTDNANIVVGTSDGDADAATTNGGTYLIIREGYEPISRRRIMGSGGTTVSSNASGHITINSPAYSTATTAAAGLMSAADKKKLNDLYMPFNYNFDITTSTVTFSIGGTNHYEGTKTITNNGYMPLMVGNFYMQSSEYPSLERLNFTARSKGSCTVAYAATSDTPVNVTLHFNVLWVKAE